MIIRIVKMHFTAKGAERFKNIFKKNKKAIAGFPGCLHLSLHEDADHENTFVTISHWRNKQSLKHYRESELFKEVWQQVKANFSAQPIAFSVRN